VTGLRLSGRASGGRRQDALGCVAASVLVFVAFILNCFWGDAPSAFRLLLIGIFLIG